MYNMKKSRYILKKIKLFSKKLFKSINKSWKKIKASIKKNYKPYISLIVEIFIYGALLNYIFFAFDVTPFNIKILIGFGLMFYFVKEEFTEIVSRCRK